MADRDEPHPGPVGPISDDAPIDGEPLPGGGFRSGRPRSSVRDRIPGTGNRSTSVIHLPDGLEILRGGCRAWASRYTTTLRTGVRAAEGAALEMPCTVFPYRGFESHPVRLFVECVRLGTLRQTTRQRAVAQLGSAPYWGCGGRWFESSQPDSKAPGSNRFPGSSHGVFSFASDGRSRGVQSAMDSSTAMTGR